MQRLGGKRRAGATGAVDDDRGLAIAHGVFDARFQESAWDRRGPWHHTLGDFIRFAHIDRNGSGMDQCLGTDRINFRNSRFDLFEQISISGGHVLTSLLTTKKGPAREGGQLRNP